MTAEQRNIKLGRRIAALREAKEIPQKALAEKLGLPANALESRERGERAFKLEELVILSGVFHMSLEELVNETPVEYTRPEDIGLSPDVQEAFRAFRDKYPDGMESVNELLAYPGFLQLLAEFESSQDIPDSGDPNAPIEVKQSGDGLYECKMTPVQYKQLVEQALRDLLWQVREDHCKAKESVSNGR